MSIRDLHGALEVRQWVGRLSQHSILRVASIDDGVPACGAASLCWCVLAARTTTEGRGCGGEAGRSRPTMAKPCHWHRAAQRVHECLHT